MTEEQKNYVILQEETVYIFKCPMCNIHNQALTNDWISRACQYCGEPLHNQLKEMKI